MFQSLIIFVEILFGPVELQLFSEEMIFDNCSLVVRIIINDSAVLSGRKSSINLLENSIFTEAKCPIEKNC